MLLVVIICIMILLVFIIYKNNKEGYKNIKKNNPVDYYNKLQEEFKETEVNSLEIKELINFLNCKIA